MEPVMPLQRAPDDGRPRPIPGALEPRRVMVPPTAAARVEALTNEVPYLPDRSPEAVVSRSLVASAIDKLIALLRTGPSL